MLARRIVAVNTTVNTNVLNINIIAKLFFVQNVQCF